MGARISPGFTIIETVLFLTVTGILVIGVLIGTGAALNSQRYRDSVESFKDLLQSQYTELSSVKNSREDNWECDASAQATIGGTEIRGQSQCLLVGKYIRIDQGDLAVYTILAYENGASSGDDITKLRSNYAYHISDADTDEGSMEWGTQIAWPASGSGSQPGGPTPRALGILFIRSPDSGDVYTFTNSTVPPKNAIIQTTFTDMMVAGGGIPGQGGRTICILSSGLAPSGDTSVYLSPYAASASAVEVRSNQYLQSIGQDTRC